METIEFNEKLLRRCNERNYESTQTVISRLFLSVTDLLASEGRYHSTCYRNFRKDKSTHGKKGRSTEDTSRIRRGYGY